MQDFAVKKKKKSWLGTSLPLTQLVASVSHLFSGNITRVLGPMGSIQPAPSALRIGRVFVNSPPKTSRVSATVESRLLELYSEASD